MDENKIKEAYNSIQPGTESRERVWKRMEEKRGKNKGKNRVGIPKPAVAAALLALVLIGGTTSYALWRYLTPAQVAGEFEDKRLSEAFQAEKSATLSEKQTFDDYAVTLLGLLSGKDLSERQLETDGDISADRTYCVAAIERTDGAPMPEFPSEEAEKLDFLTTPLIEGTDPMQVNLFTMNSASITGERDGIWYILIECDGLSVFADRNVYLAVVEGKMPSDLHIGKKAGGKVAYIYDRETGETRRNEAYQGMNALFVLPLDEKDADPEKAEQRLKTWTKLSEQEEGGEDAEPTDVTGLYRQGLREAQKAGDKGEAEYCRYKILQYEMYENGGTREDFAKRIQKEFTLLEDKVKTVRTTHDKENGVYHYHFSGGGKSGTTSISDTQKPGVVTLGGTWYSSRKHLVIQLVKRNKDNTVTILPYEKKF